VPVLTLADATLYAEPLCDEILDAADCVVILTDHTDVDYEWVACRASLVVDTRNATAKATQIDLGDHVWRLVRPAHRPPAPDMSPRHDALTA
jgi:UDP-N-acetyl-D-glucosamine dehydrogenase